MQGGPPGVCRIGVILHVDFKYSEMLGGPDPVAPSIECLRGKGFRSLVERATPVETEPTHKVKRSSRHQWDILGYDEAAIGVAFRDGFPGLAHCSEIATPGLNLAFISTSVDEPVKVVGIARGLDRRVVEDFVEYLLPDFNWEGWQHGVHSQECVMWDRGWTGWVVWMGPRDARDEIKALY